MTPLVRQGTALALAALLIVHGRATAQGLQPADVLLLSSDPEELKGVTDAAVRPNTSQNFFMFVKNPTDDERTFLVELSARGAAPIQSKVKLAKGGLARVRFAKPAVPPATPVAAAPATPAPPTPPPPPPPGMELSTTNSRAMFTLRLLYEDNRPVLDRNNKPYERSVSITIQRPNTYVEIPTALLNREETVRRVEVEVKTKNEFSGPPGNVSLIFPPQLALKPGDPGPGAYQWPIDRPGQSVRLYADDVPLNPDVTLNDEKVRFHVNVDGYERAFIFNPDFTRGTVDGKAQPINDVGVRAYPVVANPLAAPVYALPVEKFPVRVEVDNAPADAQLELHIQGGTPPKNEAAQKAAKEAARFFRFERGVRDERIWLEPAGPDDGLFVSNRSSDWVKEIDARALRGKHEFVAVLRYKADGQEKELVSGAAAVIFDATGPDQIDITAGPQRLVKGKPLPVRAVIRDSETTPVVAATFFLGRPDSTGKIPETALKVEGVQSPDDPDVWLAELPLPPEKRGLADLTVQATNQVGQTGTKIQRIELIDALPPKNGKDATTGAVEVTVELAGKPQAKVPVAVRDADGKEKGVGITNDKGKVKIEDLQPGAYRVSAAQADSGVGTRGLSPVQVKAGETAPVRVSLSRLAPTQP